MTDAPERIWIDPRGPRWVTAQDAQEELGDVEYVRVDRAADRQTQDLEALRIKLANAPEDDCGNDRLCADACNAIGELRLTLRLMRRRMDAALALSKWTEDQCRAFAHGYDGEDAAQRGEGNPWKEDPDDPREETWKRDRTDCVRAGLKAMREAGQ